MLQPENLLPDLMMLSLGYAVALLWKPESLVDAPGALAAGADLRARLQVPQLKKEAQTDGKTGLAERRHFGKLSPAELERARRFHRPLALYHGRSRPPAQYQQHLWPPGRRLCWPASGASSARPCASTISPGASAGEEFAIVLPEAGPAEARALAERLRQAVEAASFTVTTSRRRRSSATMSLGVACFPEDASLPPSLSTRPTWRSIRPSSRGATASSPPRMCPTSSQLDACPAGRRPKIRQA